MAKKKQAAEKTDDTLTKALKRFDDSWEYQKSNWHEKWERDGKLYDGQRVKRSYEGLTDTFVPMVFPTVETMVSSLTNGTLRFDYKCGNPANKASSAPLNALIDEWWDEEGWDLAIEEGSRDFLKKGMSAFMWSWDIDRPKLDWYSMRDAIVDPTVKKPRQLQEQGSYAGRRYFVRKGALDDYEVVDTDPKSKTYGQMVKRYKTTSDSASGNTGEDDKSTKDAMFSGSTLSDASSQLDEILEIWDVDRVVTIKNRKDVIEDVVNPYKVKHEMILRARYQKEAANITEPAAQAEAIAQADLKAKSEAKGVVPFFFFRNYRDISLLYADSEVNSIALEQERLNDFTNMESDYIIKQLAAQKELDPLYEDFIDLINNDPDTVYPFKPGSLVDRPVPVLPANSFNNRLDIKNSIREATGIDQIAKGGQAASGTTATEIMEQKQSTGERIESKARILEKDGLYWMAFILFKLVQLYVDKPMVVEITGINADSDYDPAEGEALGLPKGTALFDPANYQDDWRPRISLELDEKAKKQKDKSQRREEYSILIQDPTNNLQEVKKRLYPKMFDLDKEDLDAILTPAEGAVDPLMGADPTMAAMGGAPAPGAVPAPQEMPV